MINKRIAQRFSVEKELGSGGMGTVYRGIDMHTQQIVAIKHLKPHMAQPDMLERFRREGEALRDLNHPNIVKMLAALEEEGNHYLIMEFVSGGDLAHMLENNKLPLEKMLTLAIDLADALTRAHKLNIVHRDLKPANVLIGEDGVLRLTDFGVAHVGSQQRVTDTDAIVGTIDYLPPEAFSGGTIDARADIWAFGVMLYEMLTQVKPFSRNTVMETVYAITTQPIPDLETLCPDAPIALIDLIYRMLERDPLARIASVRHVGAALEDVLHGRDTAVPSPRFETPLPETFSLPKHNLPAQTTPFVGREAELTEIARLVADPNVRLITIVAPGGMGKTRLSLVAGEHELEHFAQGVFFVELAPLSDMTSMVSAIAEATGYQFQADGRDTKQQMLDFLSQKQMLLILDNYEHLIAAAGLTTDILKAAPQVKLIATSRQRLNQTGETIFNLEGMDFPAWETPADALEYAAVKLFMQSAKRVQPQFELTAANMNSVARICKQVQGMPLGIVLAAAWLALLSPEEIAAESAQSYDFLESETGDLPERQRSMRAVFEYSWNLMSDAEKEVFAKLAVFRGGFTREAAEAVAGANLRVLMALVNKSLLRRHAESGRYEIHELLRQYGEGRASTNESRVAHSHYYLALLADLGEQLRDQRQITAAREMRLEFENITKAWEWGVQQAWFDELAIGSITLMLAYFFLHPMDSYFYLLDAAVTAMQINTTIPNYPQIRLQLAWCWIARDRNIELSIIDSYMTDILNISQQKQAYFEMFWVFSLKGYIALDQHLFKDAYQHIMDAYQTALQSNNRWTIALGAFALGFTSQIAGIGDGTARTREAYNLADDIGDLYLKARAARNLMAAMVQERNYTEAFIYHQESLNITRQLGGYRYGVELSAMGLSQLESGNFEQAENYFEQAKQQAHQFNTTIPLVEATNGKAQLYYYRQEFPLALQTIQESLVLAEDNKMPYQTAGARQVLVQILHWMKRFEEAKPDLRLVIREFMPNPASNAYFLLAMLPVLYHLHAHERTTAYLSLLLNDPKQIPVFYKDPNLLSLKVQLQTDMGNAAFNAAIERGKTLDLETVVQDLLAEFAADDGM